jgi:pentose-5-phosphate-3-epimerase
MPSDRYLETFAKAGADRLLVNAEPGSTIHVHRTLTQDGFAARLGNLQTTNLRVGSSILSTDRRFVI